jgi:hypothetical protein
VWDEQINEFLSLSLSSLSLFYFLLLSFILTRGREDIEIKGFLLQGKGRLEKRVELFHLREKCGKEKLKFLSFNLFFLSPSLSPLSILSPSFRLSFSLPLALYPITLSIGRVKFQFQGFLCEGEVVGLGKLPGSTM